MFNKQDLERNGYMLTEGLLAEHGYDWWWHSFTAHDAITGDEQPFFIEYFVINPALAEDEPTFGQLPENKENGIKPSYVMVEAGAWGVRPTQLHRFFSVKDVEIFNDPETGYHVIAPECTASETELTGTVSITPLDSKHHPEWMCDSGSMSWNLQLDKQVAFNVGYGASKPMRDMNAFEMYWHAQGMKTQYSGEVVFNGRRYTVDPETSYGYADKNWGSNFTSPWVWLSSCHLISNITGEELTNSVFDIGGGRPRVFGVPLDRKLLSAFYYEGEEFEFNFSKPNELVRTLFNGYETDTHVVWDVIQEGIQGVVDVHVECPKKQMVLANYEAPDGSRRHTRLWNGGTGEGTVKLYRRVMNSLVLVDDMRALNIGCEYGKFEESDKRERFVRNSIFRERPERQEQDRSVE